MKRKFTKTASLDIIKQAGVPISAIIDVGVQYGTDELMVAYPDTPHILIETVEEYAAKIEAKYKAIPHKLIIAGASDSDGTGFLKTMSRREGEEITHSHLTDKGRPVRVGRVDTMVPELGIAGPYLLKIDVEGADIPAKIIEGSAGIMAQTNVVICEMVTSRFVDLASRIERHGFALWDIVDACYYDKTLWQTDAIFIRRSLVYSPALTPLSYEPFNNEKWWPSYA